MPCEHRPVVSHKELAEVAVAECGTKCSKTLLQDLGPVRHEEQRQIAVRFLPQPRVVERGDDRLPGAGSRDNQVAPMPVRALGCKCIERLFLMRIRAEPQSTRKQIATLVATYPRLQEALALVLFELSVIPVLLERREELFEDRLVIDS